MQDIRLLALDIDGTILGKSLGVAPAVLAAIKAVQQRGIRVAIATGRMFCSAKQYHALVASDVPLIAYNGAWIQDPQHDIPQRQLSVPAAIARDIVEYLGTEPWRSSLHLHVYHGDQLYVKELNERVFAYQERTGCQANLLENLPDILHHSPTKILAVCHHEELPAQLLPALKNRYSVQDIHCFQSTEFYVEFTSPMATKGQALKTLTEDVLGLTAQNVMAIGDNYNDLEMIQYAGLGVAMGNAPIPVQAVADHVTSSIDQDGVAKAIAKFLL